jgi:hypothetical protein
VGKAHQAVLPSLRAAPPPSSSSSDDDFASDDGQQRRGRKKKKKQTNNSTTTPPPIGAELWCARKVHNRKHVNDYLAFVRNLFEHDRHHFDEEKALFFLSQCDYSTKAATALLKPRAPPKDEEEEDYEGDDSCFVCKEGGNLLMCDGDDEQCGKVYHPLCVNLEIVPEGAWHCPSHFCTDAACDAGVSVDLPGGLDADADVLQAIREQQGLRCCMCPTSFCPTHITAALETRHETLGQHEFMCPSCTDAEATAAAATAPDGFVAAGTGQRNFMKRLLRLLKRLDIELQEMPSVGSVQINLYRLYHEVVKRGGLNRVAHVSGWQDIKRALGLTLNNNQITYVLRKMYSEYLYVYERKYCPYSVSAVKGGGALATEISSKDSKKSKKSKASSSTSSSSSSSSLPAADDNDDADDDADVEEAESSSAVKKEKVAS